MFDQTRSPFGVDRSGDVPYGRARYSGSSRRTAMRQQSIPTMDRVTPQGAAGRPNPAVDSETANGASCLNACSLAMVYSPAQQWRQLYSVDEAIRKGTLFAELDKPFLGKTLLRR